MQNYYNDAHVLQETVRGIQPISVTDMLYSKRKIFLTETVDPATSDRLIQQLMYLEQDAPGNEITLYINSPGGDVYSGLAVYDLIMALTSPVRTVCMGTAASMGSILFLAGQERDMLPHSQIMIHDPAFGGGGLAGQKPLELQEKLDGLLQTRETLGSILAERTGHTLDEIYERTKTDTYFRASEALDFGIATRIIEGGNI